MYDVKRVVDQFQTHDRPQLVGESGLFQLPIFPTQAHDTVMRNRGRTVHIRECFAQIDGAVGVFDQGGGGVNVRRLRDQLNTPRLWVGREVIGIVDA